MGLMFTRLPNLPVLLWENEKIALSIHRMEVNTISLPLTSLINGVDRFYDFKLNDVWQNKFYDRLIDVS